MSDSPAIVWFRNDLRLSDNPALHAAARTRQPLSCLYIHDETPGGPRRLGAAARWWLHQSLAAMAAALAQHGGQLTILQGATAPTLQRFALAIGADKVFFNRRYDDGQPIDGAAMAALARQGIEVATFNGHLLHEPWTLKNKAGAPFRVFTAYWRTALQQPEPGPALPTPRNLRFHAPTSPIEGLQSVTLASLGLEPRSPDWAGGLRVTWTPTEAAARTQLKRFLSEGLIDYTTDRDRPDRSGGTSRLSPYLSFGNISVRQVWHGARAAVHTRSSPALPRQLHKFLAELGWREFNYHVLHHYPDLATRNFQPRFDALPWRTDRQALEAWQRGLTGYPLVDAGLRELWTTGWMHNRVRMVVASFLTKHLLLDWRCGERWFWDTLVDADPANNPANWQWVAGSGADAAPYFRIFNPVLQGEKFDPEGAYVRHWVPELARLPAALIHKPWAARPSQLAAAGVALGKTYPRPIVDHDFARRRALGAARALERPRSSGR